MINATKTTTVVLMMTLAGFSFSRPLWSEQKPQTGKMQTKNGDGPEKRAERLKKELNLSDSQKSSVKKIWEENKSKHEKLKNDFQNKNKALREETHKKIMSVLNDGQKEKFERIRTNRKEKKEQNKARRKQQESEMKAE